MPIPKSTKRLDVVIMGEPNVGKSVLLNCLIKNKLAASTKKRHTTRGEILGVFNHRNIQLAFYDTPGFVSVAEALRDDAKTLRERATDAAGKADVIMIVIDAARVRNEKSIYAFSELTRIALDNAKIEIILILNKVDLVEPKEELLDITREYVSLINGIKLGPEKAHLAELDTTVFMISATKNDGVIDIKNYLLSIAPMKPWIIDKDGGITDLTNEERVEEMVLEALMDHTHEEIPYIADIVCKSIESMNEDKLRIDVDIGVSSRRQQKIVVGQQGRTMVKIRQAAVAQLEKIFKKEVILFIWVIVNSTSRENKDDE